MKRISSRVLKKGGVVFVVAIPLITGCATKNYPVEGYTMPAEAEALTCRELYLKQVEAQGVRDKIQDTANTSWLSIVKDIGTNWIAK